MGQTYYEILGIAENATAAEIEAAFKAKAKEVHPDTVPAENTYLRQVAAEAFKDLSEAKAVLLDADRRQRYDSGLTYSRATSGGSGDTPSPERSTGTRGSSRDSVRSRSASRSRISSTQAQSRSGGSSRSRKSAPQLPTIKNLNAFLFMILGGVTIFFLVVLVGSGRMPPLWLAALTACLGILCFVNGMRPNASTIASGRAALVVSAVVLGGIFLSLLMLSPSYFEIALARRAENAASRLYKLNKPKRPAASHLGTEGSSVATDESGTAEALPAKVWSNLKDGQNYRSRVNGDAMFLEAMGSGAGNPGEITSCEFHRAPGAAPSWVGVCAERGLQGENEHKSMATLSQFSDTRLEGSTGDIPVFVMTPVESVQMGAAGTSPALPPVAAQVAPQVGPPAEGETIAEPDLSALASADKESIEATCTSEKLMQGPAKYNECVRNQVEALRKAPRPRGFSKLSSMDRDTLEFACTTAKLQQGPAAYNLCLAKQMAIFKKQKP
jgi:hypothetical protein